MCKDICGVQCPAVCLCRAVDLLQVLLGCLLPSLTCLHCAFIQDLYQGARNRLLCDLVF